MNPGTSNSTGRRTPCGRCGGSREIRNDRLGTVRCPTCTTRKLPRTDWRPMNAAEKRRREQEALARSVKIEQFKFPGVPNAYITTDRVLMRWGCDGTGMPADDPETYRESLPPPLDPGTFVEVNRIVMNAPKRLRKFAIDYYRSYNPAHLMKKNWKLSPRQIGRLRVDILAAYRDLFLQSTYPDLLTLIRFLPEQEG